MAKPDLLFYNNFYCNLLESPNPVSMTQHHYHDAYEIFFPVAGKRYMAFNSARQLLQRGTVFIAQPFVPHGSERHESGYYKRYILNFSQDDLLPHFSDHEIDAVTNHLATGVYHLTPEQTDKLEQYLMQVTEYHNRNTELGQKMAHIQLFLTLDYLNTLLADRRQFPTARAAEETGMHPAVHMSMEYVKGHYAEDIDLDFISELIHLSKSQFCRVFQAATGTSFMQYLNSYRLSKAHVMISHTKKPLHAIAEETGFYSTEHMTRTFEKTYNMSPSRWRRTYVTPPTQGQNKYSNQPQTECR